MRTTLALATFALALTACEPAPPKMHVDVTTVPVDVEVVVNFDTPLTGRAMNQYWVALQPASAPASDTTGRVVLERTDRVVRLRAPAAGAYEVRLHGGYPKVDHKLLSRIPITVDGLVVKTGNEQRANLDE